MRNWFVATCVSAVLALSGCTTAVQVQTENQSPPTQKLIVKVSAPATMPPDAQALLVARLNAQLSARGALADQGEAGAAELEVRVLNYTMRGDGARFFAGVLAGSDNVQSAVRVIKREGGAVLAEFTVESANITAWGTSRGMVEGHADKILATLAGGKR